MAGKKHSPTYYVIFSSYLIIITVFTILMAVLFFYSANTIISQQRQMDESIAERTVQQAGDQLESLYAHGEMLMQDDRLNLVTGLSPALQKMAGAEIGKIMDRANDFTGLTSDLFFCPAGPDLVMDKTGVHEGDDLEAMLQSTLGISAEEWKERASFEGERSFQVVAAQDPQGEWHYNFLMMLRKQDGKETGKECIAAGVVPVTMLSDIASAMRPEGYEDIIAEYPGGIYSFSRQSLITREELEETQQGGIDIFSLLFSGKPVHTTTKEGKRDTVEWKIHFFCPMDSYRSIVLVCLRTFIVSVLVVLVLGSLLLHFTITTQYRPLRILMDRLSGRRRDSDPSLRREYVEIDRAIGDLQKKQQGTESRLVEYRTRLQKTAVDGLLRGNGVREGSLVEFFRSQELNLRSEKCRVLLLALDADEKMNGLDENDADDLLQRLLEDLENVVYQCMPDSCCVIGDDCVECLVCCDSESRDAESLQFMKESLMDFCRANNMHFYGAISEPETGTEGARRAFLQAESILDHATMTGHRDVLLEQIPEQYPAAERSGQEIRQQQLLDYVNEHYTDASLSVLQMADAFDMSPSSVSRTFKQAADTGLNTYIHTLRVAKAKELIENTRESLKRISEEVGYGNQITMIRAFKKLEGITPKEYRDRILGIEETDSGLE